MGVHNHERRLAPSLTDIGSTQQETGARMTVLTVCMGSAAFVTLVVMSLCLAIKRRVQKSDGKPLKQFLLPKETKPVIGFRTAAGPGGLKNSPSPIQSPENVERDWLHRCSSAMTGDGSCSTSMSKSVSYPSDGGLSRKASLAAAGLLPSQSAVRMGTKAAMVAGELKPLMARDATNDDLNHKEKEKYDPSKKGAINFTLSYNFEKNALLVHVIGATNLPPKNCLPGAVVSCTTIDSPPNGEPESMLDPYIKIQLLPEKQHKVKTRVVRNTLNPNYDEEFTFYGLGYNQLQSTTLHFVVVTFDRFSRDEIVGEVVCPLHTIDLSKSDQRADVSMDLVNRTSKFKSVTNRGDILVSLCYQPATSNVTAVILKAKNLPKFDITGFADPYVKVYMLFNGQKMAKKKTHVKKRTLAPVFNESFTFDVPVSKNGVNNLTEGTEVAGVGFEFLVMDWDRVTKNEVMGRLDVGPRAKSAAGRQHWAEVCRQPDKQVAEWHRLRP